MQYPQNWWPVTKCIKKGLRILKSKSVMRENRQRASMAKGHDKPALRRLKAATLPPGTAD